MSYFDSLITAEFKQLHYDMISATVDSFSVSCQIIMGDTKFTECTNCYYNSQTGKSSGKYKSGGPIPFDFGLCPYCRGAGKIADEQTEIISLAPIYDYKHWVPGLSPNLQSPNGFVQTVSKFETFNTLKKAKELIIDTAVNTTVKNRFQRYSEPTTYGFGSSQFIITIWKRLENG